MVATAAAPAMTEKKSALKVKRNPRSNMPATLEEFLQWQPEDKYKYEWNNGIIEKSTKMITPQQLYLVKRLNRLLAGTKAYKEGAELICEVQNRTSETQVRIPDIAYYTAEQIEKAAKGDYQPVTVFAMEIISDNDKFYLVHRKLKEYFKAGVEVVWLILPEFKEVHVYDSPTDVKICAEKTKCSAEKVIPGFAITAADLFKP